MISKLPDAIIHRISAGEVITSPLNVVKECLENSIDANSTEIIIDISKDCLSLKISDNGDGIEYPDFKLLCERNCTSKINEDLLNITTFGFRGEALCSVSLVSNITVESKCIKDDIGTVGIYKNGKLISISKKAMNKGTSFSITDLFYNHLSRKDYFYRRKDEINKIYHLVAKYAICYSNIKFLVFIDKNLKEDFNMKINVREMQEKNSFNLFMHKFLNIEEKRDIMQNVYKLDNELLISRDNQFLALYSNINCSFKNYEFILFINGRLVHSFTLKERIKKLYNVYLPKNKYPFVYIELYLNSYIVDVNVHPSKKEVIFDDESNFFDKVLKTIKDGFTNNTVTVVDNKSITDLKNITEFKNINEFKNSQILYLDPNSSSIIDLFSDRSIEPKFNKIYKLKSLVALKSDFNASDRLFMKDMSYVGEFNDKTLVQNNFNLMLFDINSILYDYFYQRLLFGIGNNKTLSSTIIISETLSIRHNKFLIEYFNIKFRDNVIEELITIDRINISKSFVIFIKEFSQYEMLDERDTFSFVLKKLASIFKDNYVRNESSFNLLKRNILFKEKYNERFKILTSVQQLYKLFDRC